MFACGATIEGNTIDAYPPGARLCVFTSPQQKHQRPTPTAETLEAMGMKGDPEKLRMNCLIMCPCTVRESGKKHQVCTFQNTDRTDGAHGHIVTCKVKSWDTSTPNKPHETEAAPGRR